VCEFGAKSAALGLAVAPVNNIRPIDGQKPAFYTRIGASGQDRREDSPGFALCGDSQILSKNDKNGHVGYLFSISSHQAQGR
jgi:hypothetical protein